MVEQKKEVKIEEPKQEKTLEEIRNEKIKEIFTKKARGTRLTDEETKIYDSVINEAQQIQQAQLQANLQAKYLEEQQKIQEELAKAKPEEFLPEDSPSINFNKGPSKVNEWVTKFLVSGKISKGKKKGGTFILKGYRDTGVELVWSKNPVRFVKFVLHNEKGEPFEYVTRVVKTKHRWKGTSIPLHIALEGVNENVDLFEGAEVELSAEYVNKALTLQWNAGLLTGLAMRDEEAGDFFKKVQPLIMILVLVLVCVMAYMMYSMYQKIDTLDIGAIKTLTIAAKNMVDANLAVQVV